MPELPSKILVAVDFSAESEIAIRHALAIARRGAAEVVLLHACTVPDLAGVPGSAPPALAHYRELLVADLRENRKRLEDLRDRHAGQGVELSHVVADGFADTIIPQVARDIRADLTVIGTHGRTGVDWLLHGSVARRVVRLAEANVLVARGEAPVGGYRRICVATDFSPVAEQALILALALAAPDARVDLVHMWHLTPLVFPGGIAFDLGIIRSEQASEIQTSGERLLAGHGRPGLALSFEAVFAPPRPGLVQYLENNGHDLVVLGSHGRRGLPRFVLGSVAEATVARAPCSALVVHAGASSD